MSAPPLGFAGPALVGSTITAAQAEHLADGTVLWATSWPRDGRAIAQRPIWRENGKWTDGRTSSLSLDTRTSYQVLRCPSVRVGDEVPYPEMLLTLPINTVLIDHYGLTAQSYFDGDDLTPRWTVTAYGDGIVDPNEVIEQLTQPITVLHVPGGRS